MVLIASFAIFKLPVIHLPIMFFDDGEMIYHAFAMSKGSIPYLDDHSHHFLGYALPILLIGKILGFSVYLLRETALIFQVLTAFGIYQLLNRYTPKSWAGLGAILFISAREPFVPGFPIQSEINLLIVLILLFVDRSEKSYSFLNWASFISGVAFTFDQRALPLLFLPIITILGKSSGSDLFKKLGLIIIFWCLAPIVGVIWLSSNGALQSFWEQTLFFPARYRVASLGFLGSIWQGVSLHRFLLTETPWLSAVGIAGYFALLIPPLNTKLSEPFRRCLLILPFILFPMAAIGGRQYDYYTVIWLPFLAILGALSSQYALTKSILLQLSFLGLYLIATIPPYFNSVMLKQSGKFDRYGSDGAKETAKYLTENMTPSDSLFVWGYRLDLYVLTQKISHFPNANQLFIHPDRKITGPERWRHISPKYEYEFIFRLQEDPPTYFVYFSRSNEKDLPSPALEAVKKILTIRYEKVFEMVGEDPPKGDPKFTVYRLIR